MKSTKMKLFIATVISLSLLASASFHASGQTNRSVAPAEEPRTISITRSSSQPPQMSEVENFTGSVAVDQLLQANEPSRLSGARVTFAPGARTAWHTHPLGQTLIVMAGVGWVQQQGGEKKEIKPGDVVWTPPGVKHWHGATATDRLTQIALTEQQPDGKRVVWMEKVSNAQYSAPVRSQATASAAPTRSASDPGTQSRPSQGAIGDFSPKLAEITDKVLYGISGNVRSSRSVTAVW